MALKNSDYAAFDAFVKKCFGGFSSLGEASVSGQMAFLKKYRDNRRFRAFIRLKKLDIHSQVLSRFYETAIQDNLMRAGAFIRKTAQQSIRYSANPAKPGTPPHTRERKTLKRSIEFASDPSTGSVVVGPRHNASNVPEILEKGGPAKSSWWWEEKSYKIGDYGIIVIQDDFTKSYKLNHTIGFIATHGPSRAVTQVMGRTKEGKGIARAVIFAKLHSPAQVHRASCLYNDVLMAGRITEKSYEMEARPFMKPALVNSKSDIIAAFMRHK